MEQYRFFSVLGGICISTLVFIISGVIGGILIIVGLYSSTEILFLVRLGIFGIPLVFIFSNSFLLYKNRNNPSVRVGLMLGFGWLVAIASWFIVSAFDLDRMI